jgi:hypothetical protein
MMKYKPGQVGAGIYAEKMAALADEYPEYLERLEAEAEIAHYGKGRTA